MKKINIASTRIFVKLLSRFNESNIVSFPSPALPTLTIERLQNVLTSQGKALLYSLKLHHEEGKSSICDHCMRFIVLDKRIYPNDLNLVEVYPQYYTNDLDRPEEESAILENDTVTDYKSILQKTHCNLAHELLAEIQMHGYLKKAKIGPNK